jgi:hypothetical protein
MQYPIRKVSNTLDTVLRRWAREQDKSLNEVAIEAMARGAGLTGRTVRQSRVAQTLASQRVCGFPPATTRGSGLWSP